MHDRLTSRHGGFIAGKETNGQGAGWAPEPVWTFRGRKPFALTGIRSLDRAARSESQYRLSYPVWASLWEMHLECVGVDSVRGGDCCERGNEHLVSIKFGVHKIFCVQQLLASQGRCFVETVCEWVSVRRGRWWKIQVCRVLRCVDWCAVSDLSRQHRASGSGPSSPGSMCISSW
jgi:hypothetical protein